MSPFELATRFVGEIRELPGELQHPYIQWCHSLVGLGMDAADEIPWCSSWVNAIAWQLRLPRSKSAAARSWLTVGEAVDGLDVASIGYDVVVLKRGTNPTQGHVGFFAGVEGDRVAVLGGNQGNAVTVATFAAGDILGIRRLR